MCRLTVRQVQSRIDEFVNNARWENEEISPYGSSICDKNDNVLRAALQNIRGISNNTDNIALEEIDAMDNYILLGLFQFENQDQDVLFLASSGLLCQNRDEFS